MVVPITEIANAYVSISASTRGMGAQIDREMRGIQSKGGQYGRGLGEQVKKGFQSVSPVDVKQVEQNFTDSEKRRAAVVKRTTESVEDARRKEQIATAKLAETEKKYAADSSQVLSAKDRLVTASKKVQIEEAKQSVAVEKASRDVTDAKGALDDLSRSSENTASKSKGFGAKIGDSFRGIGRDAGTMGKDIGDSFAKIGKGDFKGAFSGLKSAFGITKREGKTAGTDTGQSFSRGIASEMSAAGSKAGSVFLGTLKGVLGAQVITKIFSGVTGIIKGAFRGGFDRIMNIQEAEIKLGTIFEGDAAKVKTAMGSVADAVDGTKFAISDAADMASQLGAAGVDAGKPMEVWLSRTADAAQFAGREFTDMQSIIGKVVATGKVTGETFEQLPLAAAALSDHLGVSQEEVRKLASQGKISAADFGEAMDKKIGGAAKDAGGSFLSMIANIKSAMNATAAKLLTPITDALMPIAGVGLTLVKGFRDNVAGPMGEALSEFLQPKAEAFATSLEKLPGFFAGVRDSFAGIKALVMDGDFKGLFGLEEDSPVIDIAFKIRDAIKDAFGAAKDVVTGFIEGFGGIGDLKATIGPVLTMLAGPLGLLRTVLLDLMDGLDFKEAGSTFGAAIRPIVDGVLALWGVVGQAAITLAGQLVPVVSNIASTLMPILADVLARVVPVFSNLVSAVAPLVGQLVSKLAPALAGIVAAVLPVVATLVEALGPIIANIASVVLPPLTSALTTLAGIISTTVVPVLAAVLMPAITQLGRLVATVFGFIAQTVNNVMNFIAGVIKVVTSTIKGDWSGAWDGIKQATSAVWDLIKSIVELGINLVKDTVLNIMGTITGDWDATWEDVKSIGSKAWGWIKDTAVESFESMVELVGKAWDGIKKIVGTPINAVIGFINKGIVGAYNFVADFLGIGKMGDIAPLNLGGGHSLGKGGGGRGVAPAFQDGGYVDLPWSSTNRDPYLGITKSGEAFKFEGEEFIVNRKQTRKYRGILEAINDGDVDPHDLPGRAGGGLVSFKGHRFTSNFASRLAQAERMGGGGMHISQGGWRPRTSYSGTSHQGDAVDITRGNHRNFIRPLRSLSIPAWDRTGMGNWASHTHGIPLPSAGTPRGSAIWQGQDYLRGGNGLGGRDRGPRPGSVAADGTMAGESIWATIGGKIAEGFKTVTDWIGGAMEKVAAPLKGLAGEAGSSPFGKLILGVGDKLKGDLSGWIKGKVSGGSDADAVDDKPKRGYANGTRYAMPGLARVNEGRPEVIDFRGGERVYSGGESERMLGQRTIRIDQITLPAIKTLREVEAFLAELEDSRRVGHMMGA